ncbi:MAG: hypothetical protein E7496_05505 [Ruminococcus sp.]|nr:hypothetical protein [Ruminococcus sp.]
MSEEIHKITEYTRENQEPKSEQLRMIEIIQQLVKLHNEYASGMLELDKKQAAADEKMHTLEMQEALLMREVEKMRSENIDYWKQKKEELVTLKKISETLGSAPSGNPPEQGEKFKKLNQENAILKKEYTELYQKFHEQESELYELKDVNESLTIQLEKLQAEQEELKKRLQEFQEMRYQLAEEKAQAEQQKKITETTLNSKISELTEWKEKHKELVSKCNDIVKKYNYLLRENQKQKNRNDLVKENDKLKKEIEKLKSIQKTHNNNSNEIDMSIYDSESLILDRGILEIDEDED